MILRFSPVDVEAFHLNFLKLRLVHYEWWLEWDSEHPFSIATGVVEGIIIIS